MGVLLLKETVPGLSHCFEQWSYVRTSERKKEMEHLIGGSRDESATGPRLDRAVCREGENFVIGVRPEDYKKD